MDPIPAVERLLTAPLAPVGQFTAASNATLLVRLTDRDPRSLEELAGTLGRQPSVDDLDARDLAVYKPQRGETPLWDFPDGTLHLREVAAYEVSTALGWDLVPATVLRQDGPFGPGSLQRFVRHDPDEHYFTLVERDDPALVVDLARTVLFDLLIDNADRKSGHVLVERIADRPPRLRLVDHGVTFNVQPKLRTVAWHLAGERIPDPLRAEVGNLVPGMTGRLVEVLRGLLRDDEVAVFAARADRVAELTHFPHPRGPRPYPWPLV